MRFWRRQPFQELQEDERALSQVTDEMMMIGTLVGRLEMLATRLEKAVDTVEEAGDGGVGRLD